MTRFATGLDAELPSDFWNCLVFDNADEVAPVMLPQQIRSSLIEDGTFAGLFGNLGGSPVVGPQFQLLSGSLGVDAGALPAGPPLGPADACGDPRIQDGDGDGLPEVNVGAFPIVPARSAASERASAPLDPSFASG